MHDCKDGDMRGIKLVLYSLGFETSLHSRSSYKPEQLVGDCFTPAYIMATSPPALACTLHLQKWHDLVAFLLAVCQSH